MLYVREDITSNLIAFEDKPIESRFIELNLQNAKVLINCSCNLLKFEVKKHLIALRNSLNLPFSKYEKTLVLGDFNEEIEEENMKSFSENYNLKSLMKQSTCYKNPKKPSSIHLILTKVPHMFQSTCVIVTGLSDFHLMTLTDMRKTFNKIRPSVINSRFYRAFF